MTREEKEKFICEVWEKIHSPEDKISLIALTKLRDEQLDEMVRLYQKIYNK